MRITVWFCGENLEAIQWLRWLVGRLSSVGFGFDRRPVNVGLVMNVVALGQVFLHVFCFPDFTVGARGGAVV